MDIAYLFDTTNYRSLDELEADLDRSISTICDGPVRETLAYRFEGVETVAMSTLQDGSLFITGRLVFQVDPDATRLYRLETESVMQWLLGQSPGGIRVFSYEADDDE